MDRLERVQMKAVKVIKGLPYEGRLKELGHSPWRRLRGGPHHSIPIVKQLQRGWRLSLHKERTRGNRCKWYRERFHLDRRDFFFSENNQSLKQPPQGCGKVSITRGFQDVVGQCYIISSRLPFPQKAGPDIFQGPFQPRLFYGSVIL